jgi:hypothetical protein
MPRIESAGNWAIAVGWGAEILRLCPPLIRFVRIVTGIDSVESMR